MKKTLLFLLSILCFQLVGQITVTNTSFPMIGDTLSTAIDGAPVGVEITAPGGDQAWNFSSLQGVMTEVMVRPPSEGMNADLFPNANLFFPVGADGVGGESYAFTNNDNYQIIGFVGPDPVNLGINVRVPFSPPIVERRSPMNFFDVNNSNYAILVAFPTDSLPGAITNDLPIVPDSIRLRVAANRVDVVDAWGTLTIPGGTYEVLREKRTEIRETLVEAKVGIGPFASWVDVTEFLGGDLIGPDTITTYVFANNIEKENIAEVTVTNDDLETPISVTYKSNDVITNVRYVNTGRADIFAYPNPAINDVRINFLNITPGNYTFRIFNILGKEVVNKQYNINGDHTIGIDIDTLQKGTYLYNLTNAKGKVIKTKRLMVIRP